MPNDLSTEEGRTWGVPTATEIEGEAKQKRDETGDTLERARETASEAVGTAKEKAMEGAEQAKDSAAGGLETAAEAIRERTASTEGIQGKAGEKLAEGMEKTAGYLREHDTREIIGDVEIYVREHPTQAVLGAVAVGFILGRMMR